MSSAQLPSAFMSVREQTDMLLQARLHLLLCMTVCTALTEQRVDCEQACSCWCACSLFKLGGPGQVCNPSSSAIASLMSPIQARQQRSIKVYFQPS